jgi:hypothetical protein
MMFKILLAASTAIIVGLLLFPPRSGSDQRQPSRPPASNQGLNPPRDPRASGESPNRNDLEEGDFKMDSQLEQQIRLKAEEEYQEVQAQLRSILDSEPVHVTEARKLLQTRRRKALLAKVGLLGKESFGGKMPRAPENKLTLQLLDKELKLVSEQLDLLARADHKD